MSDNLPSIQRLRDLAFRAGNEVTALENAMDSSNLGIIVLDLEAIRAYHMGRQLPAFDRELRRTATIQRADGISLLESLPYNVGIAEYVVLRRQ
jgi:hypothetical protein